MKVLVFPSEKIYEMFYEGLCTGTTKGQESRKLAKIQTKLELVGTPIVVGGKESLLYTLADSTPVELEDAEFDIAKKIINEVEWNNIAAKRVASLLDFIDAVPTKEQYEASSAKQPNSPPTVKLEK